MTLPANLLPHTVDVLTPTLSADRYGHPTPNWALAATATAGAFVQPVSAVEDLADRDTILDTFVVFTNAPIDALDRVVWAGGTYEAAGSSEPFYVGAGTVHHYRTTIRRAQ